MPPQQPDFPQQARQGFPGQVLRLREGEEMQLADLSDAHRRMALSETNRFYAWEALGRPDREATVQECAEHFLEVLSKAVPAHGEFEVED